MKIFYKMLTTIGIFLGAIIVIVLILGTLFINYYPSFGGNPDKNQKEEFAKKNNYKNGIFINQIPTDMSMSFSTFLGLAYDFMKGNPNRSPLKPISVEKIDSISITKKNPAPRVTWFGHSAILLEMDGKNILIDPMLGPSPSPHPLLGSKRYSAELPIEIEKLPPIDALIISHDHYDHLDYPSIIKLKSKVKNFYVPLGVGAHLQAWGVEKEKINELNWWDEIRLGGLLFRCTPARHFSGRGLFNRFTTLWASWVIKSAEHNIYFSGDSGYGPHFKEIGDKYGPFDLAMMECGQYDMRWINIHMMPEQTAQAFIDVKGKLLMPIHWGAFSLALHSWKDPVERLMAKAKELNLPITTPQIGEPILIGQDISNKKWWEKLH